jgi:membrane protein
LTDLAEWLGTVPFVTDATPQTDRPQGWRAWLTLVQRTLRDMIGDRVPGLAAEVAFFLMLSLPPLLLVLLGLLGYVADWVGPETVEDIRAAIVDGLDNFLSQTTIEETVKPALDDLLKEGRADVLTIGAIVALWSGSRSIRVIVEAVTFAYDLGDRRSWRRKTLVGLGLTAALIVAAVVLLPLLVVGPRFGSALADEFGLAAAFEVVWAWLYWPVVAGVGVVLLTWVYHIAPPWLTAWRRDLPGAVLALLVWLIGSFGLRFYATNFIEANSAFSYFATPLVILLWLYVTALAVLVGAELNAEIEKMWPQPGGPYDTGLLEIGAEGSDST